jgi:hypothetical protein
VNRLGAGEGCLNTSSAQEKIGILLITTSLPAVVGSFTFKQEPNPEKWLPLEVVLRGGYDSDPSVVLVILLDYMNAAVASNASGDYLEGLFRLTGLKPQQARLRFDKNTGKIIKFETSR